MGYFSNRVMHCKRCWLAILIYFIICLSSKKMGVVGSGSNETDRLALLAFKSSITVDPFGIMRSWNDSIQLCEWYGVTCGKRHPRITQLKLNSLKLEGSISPHIGNLSFLQVLQLQNNSLIHQIPPEIGRLQRLQVLDVRNNSLGGEIPLNLSSCSKLESLYLHNNMLHGKIPSEIAFLSKLQHFGATNNNLTGSLPPSLGNLTSLETLFLAMNSLGGRLPITLGNLSRLTEMSLALNYFSGELPSSILNLTSLQVFEIASNQLGEQLLPSNMFHTLPNIQYLSVGENQFTGSIPISLSNASNLQVLQIGDNKLTGSVPSLERLNMLRVFYVSVNNLGSGVRAKDDLSFLCSLANITALQLLEMSENYFGGMLPGCIGNLSSQLIALTIYQNNISGSIPPSIGELISLEILLMYGNAFTGIIPPTIGNLTNLFLLYLSVNNLSGPIPSSLGKLSSLNQLDLSFNSLEGTIPLSLENCTSLQRLRLDQNNLNGSIPPQLFTIPSLSIIIDLAGNQLTGSLPNEVGKLININTFDLSENRLSGKIPDTLGECTSLQYLYLDNNNFQGSIPSLFSALKGLQELYLSSNNLSGQIPESLTSINGLVILDLSFNHLEGAVPTEGVFSNATATSLKGNNKLCGGIPAFHLVACSSSHERKKRKLSAKTKVIFASVIGLVGVALFITILLLYVLVLRKKRRQRREELASAPSQNPPLQFVSYGDLHRSTNGFSQGNLVGTGGIGHVYRGILGEGGQVVAIKVLNLKRIGASRSFKAECEALRNIRHKNLVKLITVCSGVDYQGNAFKALVYEFMPNGSLQNWLHPTATREDEVVDVEAPQRKLGLLRRLSIAIDVTYLLEYVHHEFGTPLVHCDIKPSNILLDNDLSGHVSDFGLAKFLSDTGFIRGSVYPSSSIGVRGTVGYTPPEYGLGSEVSTKGDVYSYGIVLLEMLTGKRPTDEMFKEDLSLHLYAKMALPTGVIDILDPVLEESFENEEQVLNPRRSMRVMDCLVSVIEIGVACSLDSPLERMDMRAVLAKLQQIKDNLLKGRS